MSDIPLAVCDFEIAPYLCALSGSISAYAREENSDEAATIVSSDEDVIVTVVVQLEGHLLHHLCGDLCVRVHLESIGDAPEYTLHEDPCTLIPLQPIACQDGRYEVEVVIEAGTIDPGECGAVYILAVTVTSIDPCGNPGHIAAFCKDACLMFYPAPHQNDNNGNG